VAGSPGIAALIGLIFTFQSVQATQQGQITDRYNAAITNIGSSSIEVRLGGIYALQRLMQDSPRDQPTVIAVLCAFVRDQTASITVKPNQLRTYRLPTDIQATLTVVGTRSTANDGPTTVIDFDGAQLPNAQLNYPHLSGADFTGANLTGAFLNRATLTGAGLHGANLTGAFASQATLSRADLSFANLTAADLNAANLTGARLDNATLRATHLDNAVLSGADFSFANLSGALPFSTTLSGATLSGADFNGANLSGAVLTFANLSGADLIDANLSGADLINANLTGVTLSSEYFPRRVNFTGADLNGAKWSENVAAPDGWVRDPRSGLLKRVNAGA
jgi:uncharacterized protein YjbI with pentapeptide repeats